MNREEKIKTSMLPLDIQIFAESEEEKDNSDDEQKEDSSNNETDSKEKEPEKKYTDDDVNNISKKNSDKAVKKLMKDLGIDNVEEAKTILANARAEKEKNKSAEDKAEDLTKALTDKDHIIAEKDKKLVGALLENRLMKQGVESSKIARAVRMIDTSSVLNDEGEVDNDLMNTEIEKLLKEFPEFKNKSEEETNNKSFKYGSDGKQDTGKAKDEAPTLKKWNRFNH